MVREKSEELYVTVPSYFRCPISMDVMKSPVSLCTGVTYDRSSIQKWLAQGHNTCPATMQVLHSTDVIPNLTLRRLISLWSSSAFAELNNGISSQSLPPLISKQQVIISLKKISENVNGICSDSLSKIVGFAKYSEENRKFLASLDDFLSVMIRVFFINVDEIGVLESIVKVLDLILSESGVREELNRLIFKSNRDCLSPFVSILHKGNSKLKTESAKILESITFDANSQRKITEKKELLFEIYRLTDSVADREAWEAGLSILIAVSSPRPVKKELIRFGIVKTAAKILSGDDSPAAIIEKAMKMLEMLSTCTEGRTAMSEDEECVTAVVQRLMKASATVTEHGITVLWSVCYLGRDRTARDLVNKINGVTKVLLVMQSNCSGTVRQMCGDLVKICRVNSKSCLATYDTKTTHIMPY